MGRARVAPTLIDRVIAWVSPGAGLRRLRARTAMAVASGYLGARRNRTATQEWSTLASSADADTLPDLDVLRARSRDLVRNDPLAQSAVSTKAVNVIGTGHVLRPEIDARRLGLSEAVAERWEEDALDIWTEWAASRDCDVTRAQTFSEMEDLVYRSRLLSGDVFVIRRFRRRPGRLLGSCLQVVEADRVSNPARAMDKPGLSGGVEMDADGAPLAYHIADRHDFDVAGAGPVTWRRIPAYGSDGRPLVLHVHGPRWRPDMTRYAPMLAPVIESLKQRSRYSEAELMAAVVSACFAIGLKSSDGDLSSGLKGASSAAPANQEIRLTEPGQIFDLQPDEEIQSFSPGRPNAQFGPFIDVLAREVGAGIDLPHELLLKSFQASYSASRAAIEMAWQSFRTDRAHHVAQFCAPVYEDVISEAVAAGLLKAPGLFSDPLARRAWLGAVWTGPARPTIDPVKDATADEKYHALGVTSLTRITAERFGTDWRVVRRRIERERAAAGAAGPAPGAAVEPAAPPVDDDRDGDDTEES